MALNSGCRSANQRAILLRPIHSPFLRQSKIIYASPILRGIRKFPPPSPIFINPPPFLSTEFTRYFVLLFQKKISFLQYRYVLYVLLSMCSFVVISIESVFDFVYRYRILSTRCFFNISRLSFSSDIDKILNEHLCFYFYIKNESEK